MVKFEGKIGTLYQIFTPCTHCKFCMMFKRKGGGQRPFEQCSKKLHFFERGASLSHRPQSRNQEYLENIYNNKIDEFWKHFNFLYLLQSNIDMLVTISLEIFILLAFQLVLCLVVWV